MARILRSRLAETDLLEIWVYIARDSPVSADRWLDVLDEKARMLAESPLIGRSREELAPRLRSFPVGRYVIFYRPLEEGIEIVRVRSSFRDLEALFDARQ